MKQTEKGCIAPVHLDDLHDDIALALDSLDLRYVTTRNIAEAKSYLRAALRRLNAQGVAA